MKRPLATVVGVVALIVVVASAAVALTIGTQRPGPRVYGPHMMSPSQSAQPGWGMGPGGGRHRGPGTWMRGDTWMRGGLVDSEFNYLAEMVAHHEEAVAAASELQRSERPQMRSFGALIVKSQSQQIDQMKQWLATWYPERSPDVDYQPMMRDLSGLSGDELDRAFLEDMIGHHMTAVMMSQQLLARGIARHPEVDTLATTIRDEQHAEIFQMRAWVAEWFGLGWHNAPGQGWGPGMMW